MMWWSTVPQTFESPWNIEATQRTTSASIVRISGKTSTWRGFVSPNKLNTYPSIWWGKNVSLCKDSYSMIDFCQICFCDFINTSWNLSRFVINLLEISIIFQLIQQFILRRMIIEDLIPILLFLSLFPVDFWRIHVRQHSSLYPLKLISGLILAFEQSFVWPLVIDEPNERSNSVFVRRYLQENFILRFQPCSFTFIMCE